MINGLKCIGIDTGQNTCTLEECRPQSVKFGVARYITTLKLWVFFFLGKTSAGLESVLAWNSKCSLLTKNFYQVRSSISYK